MVLCLNSAEEPGEEDGETKQIYANLFVFFSFGKNSHSA